MGWRSNRRRFNPKANKVGNTLGHNQFTDLLRKGGDEHMYLSFAARLLGSRECIHASVPFSNLVRASCHVCMCVTATVLQTICAEFAGTRAAGEGCTPGKVNKCCPAGCPWALEGEQVVNDVLPGVVSLTFVSCHLGSTFSLGFFLPDPLSFEIADESRFLYLCEGSCEAHENLLILLRALGDGGRHVRVLATTSNLGAENVSATLLELTDGLPTLRLDMECEAAQAHEVGTSWVRAVDAFVGTEFILETNAALVRRCLRLWW